jgi:hypothetical protein
MKNKKTIFFISLILGLFVFLNNVEKAKAESCGGSTCTGDEKCINNKCVYQSSSGTCYGTCRNQGNSDSYCQSSCTLGSGTTTTRTTTSASDPSTPAGCAASGGTWDAQIGTCGWTSGGGTGTGSGTGTGTGSGTGTGTGSGTGSGTVSTQVKCDTSSGFEEVSGVCVPTTTGLSSASVGTILSNLFVWLMAIFMILGVMAFVISGIQYLVSAGDEGMIETAKRNAKWSLVGVIVGLSGYVIIQAISTALSGQGFFF